MVLSGSSILNRLKKGEIFRPGTWDKACIREASYALRIADDGMVVGGKRYPPGTPFPRSKISIEPGDIAILSTLERVRMPRDLVGHQGIRLDYALLGLTGLMGIQVDPLFGESTEDERLFLRVANLGSEPVVVSPTDLVFNIEFLEVTGRVPVERKRGSIWQRMQRLVPDRPSDSSLHVLQKSLYEEVTRIEHAYHSVVFFGVFLLATTLLGAALAILLTTISRVTNLPAWVENWTWVLLLSILSISALTGLFGVVGIVLLVRRRRGRQRRS